VQPTDAADTGPTPPPTRRDLFTFVLMGVAAAVVFWLGWRIHVPVLDWILMIAGGFAFSVIVFLLYMVYFDPKAEKERRP
jgi:membrane associated rhomboid family serine protease